jgi:PAS domain S-box-containing protein
MNAPFIASSSGLLNEPVLEKLWHSPYPATLQDERFVLVDVNQAFLDYTGRSRAELIGLDPLLLQPAEDRDANLVQREAYPSLERAEGHVFNLRRRLLDAGGRERWFTISGQRLESPGGARFWLCVLQDHTGEQQALDASRRAQDELALWFEMCPAGMLVFSEDGTVVRSNAAFDELVGAIPVSLSEASAELQELLGWPRHLLLLPQLEHEATITLADGRRRRLLARVRSLPGDGRQGRRMAVLEDRSAEEERDVARLEIGMLMDTASIGVATFDPQRGWLQPAAPPAPGPAARRARASSDAGVEPDSSAGSPPASGLQGIGRDMVEPASMPEYERLQRALRRRERAEVRYAVHHPGSGRRWLQTRTEPAQLCDGRMTLSVVTLDITEQEQGRQRSEQLLRELSTILEGSTAGIAYLRGELLVRSNRRFERMLGFAPGEAAGASLSEAFGRRFDAATVLPPVQEALAAGRPHEVELRTRALATSPGGLQGGSQAGAAGAPFWYSLSIHPAEGASEGAASQPEAVAVLTDITRLKQQQEELQAVLAERETMFNLSDVGIAFMRGPRIARANPAMAALTGFAAPELTDLDGVELYVSARDCVEFEAAIAQALARDGRFEGSLRWVQVAVRPLPQSESASLAGVLGTHAAPDAASQAVIASFIDVEDRHRARQSLLRQAERTRAVLDSVLVGIVTTSPGGIEWMNRSARRMFGGELADFVGAPISAVATDEADHPLRHADEFMHKLEEGRSETFECRLRARDGRQFWVVGNVVLTGPPGSQAQLTFALLDIERRRQAEVSIAQAQASLQRVIETAPLAIALFDARSGRVLQANQTAANFFNRPSAEVIGRPLVQVMPDERGSVLQGWLDAAALTPEVLHREWRDTPTATEVAETHEASLDLSVAGGPARVWDVRIVALPASNMGAAQMLVVASDVTEQRAAGEARLQAAIAQREVLVREVHHRIKNNLQGVAGLLQQAAVRQPPLAPLLGEAIGQVQALAQVYGLQVGSGGLLRVYSVLQAIAGSVARNFGGSIEVAPGSQEVQGLVLPEAESIPIALALNELFTNALKHAGAATGGAQARAEALARPASEGGGVELLIANPGRLREGFDLSQFPAGVAGLALQQHGHEVQARVTLLPPSVRMPDVAPLEADPAPRRAPLTHNSTP